MKTEKTTILIFVAVTFIFGLLTNANANILVNGSFEDGPSVTDLVAVPNGSTAIDGWVVTQDAIDYIGTLWDAPDGTKSLDLDNSDGFGGIKQTFNTDVGQEYVVAFDMAGNPYRDRDDPYTKYMRVVVDDQYGVRFSYDYSFDTDGKYLPDNMGWVTAWFGFTAADTETTLAFYSPHQKSAEGEYGGYSGWCGAALDNVSVTPEPATLSLLGLGSLVLLRKRRA